MEKEDETPAVRRTPTPVLRTLGRIGAPYEGCVSRALMYAEGIDEVHVRSLVRRAALTQVLTRAFVTGGVDAITDRQLRHAALLDAGDGARLSGRSALEVHAVLGSRASCVSVVNDRPSRIAKRTATTKLPLASTGAPATVETRTPRSVASFEIVDGWPVEPVARALLQLAADDAGPLLTRAWREADFLGLLDAATVRAEQRSGLPGSRQLSRLLRAHPLVNTGEHFRSRPEYRLLAALLELGVPRPLVNATVEIGGRFPELDFFFPEAQLNVEVDGPQHLLPTRRREDEERDAFLREHGVEVKRIPHAEVDEDAAGCARSVVAARDERVALLSSRNAA